MAASFRQAVVDVLVTRARTRPGPRGAGSVWPGRRGGGQRPAAHDHRAECEAAGLQAFLPSPALCTDNAAMVAAAGTWALAHRGPSPLTLGAEPNLALVA